MGKSAKKQRLDQLLFSTGLAASRTKAEALIMSGQVLVNEQKITKPGTPVDPAVAIRILGDDCPFVSRGGLKLAGALKSFKYNPLNNYCLDIGASTGGFTDCLLQNGARQVIALDVGHNQLAWKIRSDPRVIVIENCNFRYVTKQEFQDRKIDLVTIDVSFISLDKIFPPLNEILQAGSHIIALVKPQFEAGREQVGKGGLVLDPAVHLEVLHKIKTLALNLGWEYLADGTSALKGTDGNQEYFVFLKKPN